jgi:acyl-CoA thioesterase-1
MFALALLAVPAGAAPKSILALGDSLTAGLGLDPQYAFPVRLEQALRARGHDVTVVNAGVSGDTLSQGEARLDWALGGKVDAVIVELGANDALRGLDPVQAEESLGRILSMLKERKLPTLLAGMRSPPNLGTDYAQAFEGMYVRQAKAHGTLFYPFFLDGVAGNTALNQADGMHPTAAGVDVIVARILPSVEALLMQLPQ